MSPSTPLPVSTANAETVLIFGAGIPEAIYGTAVFAANHLSALSNSTDNPAQVGCDDGGDSSATNRDEDASATLTVGDTVNVVAPSGCFERLFADPVSGNFDIALSNAYTGVNGNARFDGVISLTSDFQIDSQDDTGAPITITVVGDINFSVALRGDFIQALSLSLDAGNDVLITVGTDRADPVVERVVDFSFLRRTSPSDMSENNYLIGFEFSLESEALEGSIACRTTAGLRGRNISTPTSGRYVCSGANDSGAALVSDRADTTVSLSAEVDANGDGSFDPLTTGDLFWQDFVEGQLFAEDVDPVFRRPSSRAFGTVTMQRITAAVNDIIYNPVNDRLYVSNATGIVELDPVTLEVLRSADVPDVPTELALSDDGSTLWFGLSAAAEAGRLDVASMQPGSRIQFEPPQGFPDERIVDDIVVVPGTTDDIVVTVQRSEEVIAFNNGVALPNRIDRGASTLVFRDADSLVGVNDTNTGFDTYRINYDAQSGVVVDELFRGLSPAFDSPLQLGSVDIWNSRGYSFNEIDETRTGRVNGRVGQFEASYDYVVVSLEDGVVYALDSSDDVLEIFDEATRARIGAFSYDAVELDVGFLRRMVSTPDSLIVAGDSGIVRFAKTDLVPNISPDTCTVLAAGDLLVDGPLDTLECRLRDIAYDADRNLIYAAVAGSAGPQGNSIAVIDPEDFTVQAYVPLTAEPTSIDISDDGAVLTATLANASQVAEIDLATRTLTRVTPLGFEFTNQTQQSTPLIATAARARPGFPGQIAVAVRQDGLRLFEDGALLPDVPLGFESYTRLFFDASDSTRLVAHFASNVTSFRLNGNGLDSLGTTRGVLGGPVIARRGNRLLDGNGEDLDIGTLIGGQACDFDEPGFGPPRAVAFGTDPDTAFFARLRVAGHELWRCDLSTGQVGDSVFVPVFAERDLSRPQRLFQLNNGDLAYLHEETLLKLAAPD